MLPPILTPTQAQHLVDAALALRSGLDLWTTTTPAMRYTWHPAQQCYVCTAPPVPDLDDAATRVEAFDDIPAVPLTPLPPPPPSPPPLYLTTDFLGHTAVTFDWMAARAYRRERQAAKNAARDLARQRRRTAPSAAPVPLWGWLILAAVGLGVATLLLATLS